MTIKELVSKIAKLEGKKHQASVGDVREIVGLVSDEVFASNDPVSFMLELSQNGKHRAKRKAK